MTTMTTMTSSSPRVARRHTLPRFLAALALAAGIVAVDVLRGENAAWAVDYPSWDDVLAARSSESAKNAEVANIQSLIVTAQAEVEAAQQLAVQKSNEFQAAQEAYDLAVYRADELAAQAVEAGVRADASNRQAGQLISQLTRTGGVDLTVNLIVSGDDSDDLLYQLGTMSRLTETASKLHEQAAQDRNTATALTAQADTAESELEGLRVLAEQAFDAAVAAQDAAESLLAEHESQRVVLDAQLAALQAETVQTVAEYEKGVEERRKAEEAARAEAQRQAAERAAAAAAAAAAAGGGGGGGTPPVSVDGWSSPLARWRVSDEFGMRFHPIDKVNRLHAGIDLVSPGGTCGVAVYAAASGTVTQASYNGGLGNSVTINHGGGLTTVYGHNSSLAVSRGQSVGGGQLIAYAGTTGSSTGCHVHFETRVNGTAQNPRNYVSF